MNINRMDGENLSNIAKCIVALANDKGECVMSTFNGITIKAKPGDNLDNIIKHYWDKSNSYYKEYVKHSGYKLQCHEVQKVYMNNSTDDKNIMATVINTDESVIVIFNGIKITVTGNSPISRKLEVSLDRE